MMSTSSEFEDELESLGEARVRLKLEQQAYGSGKRPIVEAWLRKKEAEKLELVQKEEAEHNKTEIEIARSAKNAAWLAALAAVISVGISIAALIISVRAN